MELRRPRESMYRVQQHCIYCKTNQWPLPFFICIWVRSQRLLLRMVRIMLSSIFDSGRNWTHIATLMTLHDLWSTMTMAWDTVRSLKTESCHDANFVVNETTLGFRSVASLFVSVYNDIIKKHELVNLEARKPSLLNKLHMFQCRGKVL